MSGYIYLKFNEIKFFSTRVQHSMEIIKACELAAENFANVSLKKNPKKTQKNHQFHKGQLTQQKNK